MIDTILWDIDGTILNFLKAESYAVKKCFEIFNLGVCTDEMIERYSKINTKYWEMLERGEITKAEVLYGRYFEFFTLEGIRTDCIDQFNSEYQLRLGDKVFFNDECDKLLAKLKGKIKQYAVTNGTKIAQNNKLSVSGLDKIFDDVFISEVVGFDKPSKEFFDYVFEKTGANRESTIIVGDSLTSDILGGNNAHIKTCWYNPNSLKNTKNVKIDFTIKNLNEIKRIVDICG